MCLTGRYQAISVWLIEKRFLIILTADGARSHGPIAGGAHFALRSLVRLRIVKDRPNGAAAAAHQHVPRTTAFQPTFDFRNFGVSSYNGLFQIVCSHKR